MVGPNPSQLPLGLFWDRRFGDPNNPGAGGTVAPFGDYEVDAWATNWLGINTHVTATIHISFVGSLLPAPGTATPLPSPQASATRTPTSPIPTLTPTPTGTVGAAVIVFGTPGAGTTATPTAEPNLRATPTAESFSSWLASIFVPPAADESTTDAGQGDDPQPSPANIAATSPWPGWGVNLGILCGLLAGLLVGLIVGLVVKTVWGN